MSFIERCFPIVVDNQNYLHLDFSLVAKILSSSELNIHSEIEVFKAAITWIKHNSEERSKYAKQLLLKVRLNLLSEGALKHMLDCSLLLTENIECIKILLNQKCFYPAKTDKYYTNRYCCQNNFNILVCGGTNEKKIVVRDVHQVDGNTLKYVKNVSQMKAERTSFEAVCLKGEVYVFGGHDNCKRLLISVEKYSPSTNNWNKVTDMFDQRMFFCTCAFIDKIYVFGGFCGAYFLTTNSCLEFDRKEKSWKKVSEMNVARNSAACTVFQGNIVVAGGKDGYGNVLNTVQLYDVFADKWSPMSNMIDHNRHHSLVTVKDKLFVIGIRLEVYDNVCRKFIVIKMPIVRCLYKAISIGNKILFTQSNCSIMICYNIEENKWSKELCEATNFLKGSSCTKLFCY